MPWRQYPEEDPNGSEAGDDQELVEAFLEHLREQIRRDTVASRTESLHHRFPDSGLAELALRSLGHAVVQHLLPAEVQALEALNVLPAEVQARQAFDILPEEYCGVEAADLEAGDYRYLQRRRELNLQHGLGHAIKTTRHGYVIELVQDDFALPDAIYRRLEALDEPRTPGPHMRSFLTLLTEEIGVYTHEFEQHYPVVPRNISKFTNQPEHIEAHRQILVLAALIPEDEFKNEFADVKRMLDCHNGAWNGDYDALVQRSEDLKEMDRLVEEHRLQILISGIVSTTPALRTPRTNFLIAARMASFTY